MATRTYCCLLLELMEAWCPGDVAQNEGGQGRGGRRRREASGGWEVMLLLTAGSPSAHHHVTSPSGIAHLETIHYGGYHCIFSILCRLSHLTRCSSLLKSGRPFEYGQLTFICPQAERSPTNFIPSITGQTLPTPVYRAFAGCHPPTTSPSATSQRSSHSAHAGSAQSRTRRTASAARRWSCAPRTRRPASSAASCPC